VNRRGNFIRLGLILLLAVLCLSALLVRDFHMPWDEGGRGNNTLGMSLGLDLAGGIHLVYEANLSEIGNETADAAMKGAIEIISKRVDAYGVSEPVIGKQGADRISIQLPGVRDMERAIELVGQTAQLDFRELTEESWLIYQSAGGNVDPDSLEWVPATAEEEEGNNTVHLTGKYLTRNNQVEFQGQTGIQEPVVAFEFNDEGAKLFKKITGRLYLEERPLGIFLDDSRISSPRVQAEIEARGVITGLSLEEAQDLAILLNAGALPVPLGHWERGVFIPGPAVQDEVDPTLGADSIRKSLIAGVIGLLLVLVFMIAYYRLPGALAGGALIIYGILVLAAFKLIPVTLTLAGIAAFILSIGMAVDANVLIFERLREELRAGRTLGGAIETGFSRAWTAIRDSNVTTLIICAILYWMGSNFAEPKVQGFALTLAIGIALSMFTAIVITRTFLRLFVGTTLANRLGLFGVERTSAQPESEEQE